MKNKEIEIQKLRDELKEMCDDLSYFHSKLEEVIIKFNKLMNGD